MGIWDIVDLWAQYLSYVGRVPGNIEQSSSIVEDCMFIQNVRRGADAFDRIVAPRSHAFCGSVATFLGDLAFAENGNRANHKNKQTLS